MPQKNAGCYSHISQGTQFYGNKLITANFVSHFGNDRVITILLYRFHSDYQNAQNSTEFRNDRVVLEIPYVFLVPLDLCEIRVSVRRRSTSNYSKVILAK